ncbi:MAG: hypothetical protein NW216_04740 [Hyphomicrobium sp.]|nr:hypothetical protein [Hyphomicrobium sp.]
MRILVAVLAVLAGLKVWTGDWLYRAGLEDAVRLAYHADAVSACQRQRTTDGRGLPLAVGTLDWSRAGTGEIMTGNARVSVGFWEVDHVLWNQRYRNPVIRLRLGDAISRVACDYDVIARRAEVSAL